MVVQDSFQKTFSQSHMTKNHLSLREQEHLKSLLCQVIGWQQPGGNISTTVVFLVQHLEPQASCSSCRWRLEKCIVMAMSQLLFLQVQPGEVYCHAKEHEIASNSPLFLEIFQVLN